MRLYTHRKAILSAIHEARKEQGLSDTRADDAATLLSVRNAAQCLYRPGAGVEARRKKLLANLFKALSKANAALEAARACPEAVSALGSMRPIDVEADVVALDLDTLADGLQAFSELSSSAARLPARRTTIEVLLEFFSLAYKLHTGTVPSVRKYDGGHGQAGKAYGPFLDYICAVAGALDIACSPEGVATAFGRMGDEGKHWLREPFVPAEERFRGLEHLAED